MNNIVLPRSYNKSVILNYCRLFLLIPVLLVAACSFSMINHKNSMLAQNAANDQVASVYFIRPMPLKHKGVADNEISVDLNNELLLKINEGQYTLVKIKPESVHVVTRSKTDFTNKLQPIDVTRTRQYQFLAGKIYFIELKRINEEFRGIYYDPAPISFKQAKQLCVNLHAIGDASREALFSITSGTDVPQPGPLAPALPENLYPDKPYMIKKDPDYTSKVKPQQTEQAPADNPPATQTPQQNEQPPADNQPAPETTPADNPWSRQTSQCYSQIINAEPCIFLLYGLPQL